VVVAYGHILPKWMIDLPRLGCINLHASLLPKYRGAAPIQWSLIRGETVTGVTTMRIDVGLDTGDILLKREVEIQDDDTAETLGRRLSQQGADLMIETLRRLEQGGLAAQPQDHAQATLAPILKKEDGRIDWNLPAIEIWNRIRGLRPWPGAYTKFRGKNLHIWAASRPLAGDNAS
jgi:methionyl-tRNA formyltransferase